ncbi:MAG: methyltransferase domain-containing protein [Anaerolineae bacterium]|nr:methyltransferase domain-containing protein [Anaerolineae bacterium]
MTAPERESHPAQLTLPFDWQQWYARWEMMQNAYLPCRKERFELICHLAGFPAGAELSILDLGCGPGSLGFYALQHFPNASVLAVDTDPRLIAMGEAVAANQAANVVFVNADTRNPQFWSSFDEMFHLVISATALHWLTVEHLAEVYRRIYSALQPGGWFFNADHIASDDPDTQKTYRTLLNAWQRLNFNHLAAEDWNSYWQDLTEAFTGAGMNFPQVAPDTWEGSDDGLPRSVHFARLNDLGFERAQLHWQYLGEALLAAQKPAWSRQKLFKAYARLDASQREGVT